MLEACHIGPVTDPDPALVRAVYDTFNETGRLDPDLFAPDVEWHNAPEMPGATVHRGLDAIMADIEHQSEAFEGRRFEILEIVDADEHLVVFLKVHAIGKASGVPVSVELAHVLTLRHRKVAMVRAFIDRDRALREAGVAR